MNSRKSGDIFEALFALFLTESNIPCVPESEKKYQKLTHGITLSKDELHCSELLQKVFKIILDDNKIHGYPIGFKLPNDNLGKGSAAETADVKLLFKNGIECGISLKRNNKSLKAQRPGGLPVQLEFSETEKVEFNNDYKKKIVKPFKELWKHIVLFKDLSSTVKQQLYLDVNTFQLKYINLWKNSRKHISHDNYFNFLAGGKTSTIIIWNPRHKKLSYCKAKWSSKQHFRLEECTILKDRRNVIQLKFSSGHIFNMRLHNASSKIGKNIALKYDTVLTNFNDLFDILTMTE